MLVGQVREIGVMKSLGASSRQIGTMYLGMAFALGVVSCAIAIPLAAVVGRAYANFTAELLNFSTTGFAIPLSAIVAQVVVGLTFPVLAASIPVVRGCRIPVAEALRDTGFSSPTRRTSGADLITRLSSRGGVRRPLLFSLRNAFRRRERMALTLATLALGGGVYMGARNLKTAVRGAVDLTFGAQRYDMGLRLVHDVSADSVEALLRNVQGARGAEAWGAWRAAVVRSDSTQSNVFPVSVVPTSTTLFEPRVSAGRWFTAADTNALVVNRRLSIEQPALVPGATVSLTVNGVTQAWTVVGISATGTGPQAYAPRAALAQRNGGAVRVDRLVVQSAMQTVPSQLDLMQRIRSALADAGMPVSQGQLMAEARAAIEDHLLMVASFLGVMGQLMIVVGGLALASTMGMAVLERTREIGVLRAIGAPHRAIFTMIQTEGLVIALLGWLVAIPISLPMSVLLGRAFGRIMLPVEVRYLPDARGVVEWLAVAVVVAVIACLLPARRAMRVPTRAALAYE
jgi:putative ABC transport system permease protein